MSTDPPTQALVGDLYRYDLRAEDPNGDELSYELVDGPEGMTLDELGRVEWIPDAAGGPIPVELVVKDAQGAAVTQSFEITVTGDATPPQVEIRFSLAPIDIGDEVTVFVIASDDVGLGSLSLTVDGDPVPLNLNGFGTLTPERVGLIPVVATATDRAGNQAVAERDLEVLDPSDVTAPVISLSGFGDDFVMAPTDIIGTVIDDNLIDYTLSVAPIGTEQFTPIFRGTEPIQDGVLGQFDPTLLDNGSYLVRLQAQDQGSNIVRTEIQVDVSGDLKLGNFQLSFTDLEIPVSGIPITVTRTYDSLRANQQDEMGFGWRLEFRDTDLRNSLGRDELFEELGVRSNAFDARTRVYITPPGGRRQAFTFDPEPRFNLGRLPGEEKDTQLFLPRFRGDRGVTSTLSVAEVYIIQGADDRFYGLNTGEYDPANVDYGFGGYYELTTKEGIVYRIDALSGDLLTVTDTNGNDRKSPGKRWCNGGDNNLYL